MLLRLTPYGGRGDSAEWSRRTQHARTDDAARLSAEVQLNPKPWTFGREFFMPVKQAEKFLKSTGQPKEVVAAVAKGTKVVDVSEGAPQVPGCTSRTA